MIASSPTMNTSVGRRNARAAFPTPLRLRIATIARMARQIGTVAPDQARERGGQRLYTGTDRDRDSQRVVDDQGRRSNEACPGPEVCSGDGIGASSLRIGVDHLSSRRTPGSPSRTDDHDGDRQDQVKAPAPATASTTMIASGP